MTRFRCASCGAEHDISEISFGADAPAQWDLLDDAELGRSELSEEQCVIESSEGRSFYVRGCLEIPIAGTETNFTWGVWVSLSESSFREVCQHWDDPARTRLGPYFGWLCTAIPCYPDTMYLQASVHQREVGLRPLIELAPSDNLLAVHQREGIPELDLRRIVKSLLHPEPAAR